MRQARSARPRAASRTTPVQPLTRSLAAAVALLVLAMATAVCTAAPQWVAAPAPGSVAAGAPARFLLYALNHDRQEVALEFPEVLECRVAGGGAVAGVAVTARRVEGSAAARLAPGAFAQAVYAVPLPASAAARQVTLSLPAGLGNPVAFETTAEGDAGAVGGAVAGGGRGAAAAAGPGPSEGARFRGLAAYEPMYFVFGPESPNIKYQISLQYELFDAQSTWAAARPWLRGFHLAYTQTSLWDWEKPSSPFFDSSYKPELFYLQRDLLPRTRPDWLAGLDLQYGLQHESNGKDGADSRSLNIAYLQPTLRFGDPTGMHLTLAPRLWAYLGGLSDNPDLPDYRGYADITAALGCGDGLQLAALVRIGQHGDRGSLQLDLTYPLHRVCGLTPYLHLQYFNGYGESLLHYDESTSAVRVGIAFER